MSSRNLNSYKTSQHSKQMHTRTRSRTNSHVYNPFEDNTHENFPRFEDVFPPIKQMNLSFAPMLNSILSPYMSPTGGDLLARPAQNFSVAYPMTPSKDDPSFLRRITEEEQLCQKYFKEREATNAHNLTCTPRNAVMQVLYQPSVLMEENGYRNTLKKQITSIFDVTEGENEDHDSCNEKDDVLTPLDIITPTVHKHNNRHTTDMTFNLEMSEIMSARKTKKQKTHFAFSPMLTSAKSKNLLNIQSLMEYENKHLQKQKSEKTLKTAILETHDIHQNLDLGLNLSLNMQSDAEIEFSQKSGNNSNIMNNSNYNGRLFGHNTLYSTRSTRSSSSSNRSMSNLSNASSNTHTHNNSQSQYSQKSEKHYNLEFIREEENESKNYQKHKKSDYSYDRSIISNAVAMLNTSNNQYLLCSDSNPKIRFDPQFMIGSDLGTLDDEYDTEECPSQSQSINLMFNGSSFDHLVNGTNTSGENSNFSSISNSLVVDNRSNNTDIKYHHNNNTTHEIFKL